MHPIVANVAEKQIKSLKWIYGIMALTVMGTSSVTLLLGPPADVGAGFGILQWTQLGLGIFGALLLGLILPVTRARLLNPDRVKNASDKQLATWGLPNNINPQIGRQAIYLTRYTAGSVISWGLATATGLYGLIVRMLGSPALVSGFFLAAAILVLVLLPPRRQWLFETIEII
jgi:hypothetical protein